MRRNSFRIFLARHSFRIFRLRHLPLIFLLRHSFRIFLLCHSFRIFLLCRSFRIFRLHRCPKYLWNRTDSASPIISSSCPGLRHTNPGPRLSPRVSSTPCDQTISMQARTSNEPSVVHQTSFESRIPVPTMCNRRHGNKLLKC